MNEFMTSVVSTTHDHNGVVQTAGELDTLVIEQLRNLGRVHADVVGRNTIQPLVRESFPTDETYRVYREGYDHIRVSIDGPEYFLNPDGSRSFNTDWCRGYGWIHLLGMGGPHPDGMQMAVEKYNASRDSTDESTAKVNTRNNFS